MDRITELRNNYEEMAALGHFLTYNKLSGFEKVNIVTTYLGMLAERHGVYAYYDGSEITLHHPDAETMLIVSAVFMPTAVTQYVAFYGKMGNAWVHEVPNRGAFNEYMAEHCEDFDEEPEAESSSLFFGAYSVH